MSYNVGIKNYAHKKWADSFLILFISFFLPHQVKNQEDAVFIPDCNDPLIVAHPGHPYCEHPCIFIHPTSTSNGTITCTVEGHCVCNPQCSDDPAILAQPPSEAFEDLYCPSSAMDPTDPMALSRCRSQCTTFCPRGVGIICGELSVHLPPMTFAKICTCSCPAQRCTPLPNSTESTPIPIPPTPPPTIINTTTNPNSTLILIFKNPIYKIPLTVKNIVIVVALKYLMVAAIIALKLFSFLIPQWALIAIYCNYYRCDFD